MASCSVQELADDAACFFAVALPGISEALELTLLCRILQAIDPVASCDVQSLMDEANCFFPVVKGGEWKALQLQLLCNISAALGASGGCTVFARRHVADFADPNGNVTGCPGDVYVQTSTGALWKKVSGENTNTGWVV